MRSIWTIMVAAMAVMFTGCEIEGKIDPNNPPVLQLDTYELNIDGGGGDIAHGFGNHPLNKDGQDLLIDVDL